MRIPPEQKFLPAAWLPGRIILRWTHTPGHFFRAEKKRQGDEHDDSEGDASQAEMMFDEHAPPEDSLIA